MKYLSLFLLLSIICLSCTQKLYTKTVSNNAVTEEGTIRISATGKGSSLPAAYDNAVELAFETLLFKGIPESGQTTPLIPDEENAKKKYASVLECFKTKDCYMQFVTKTSQSGNKEKIRGPKLVDYQVASDITINLRSLRTWLEQKQVIRKFGF
ncbi:MAG: hypothetical protein JNM19_17825 [Chitinophagaceae bacterium]|nr:hypothetical protein [Chitinophagaceae bacterium]